MKNLTKGFVLNLIACVLSLAGVIVYTMVMYKLAVVFVFLIAAIVLTVLAFLHHRAGKHSALTELVAGCNAMLNASAAVAGIYLMVNQIGYVIAELDTMDTILTFIIFEIITLLAMLVNIVSAFMSVKHEEPEIEIV